MSTFTHRAVRDNYHSAPNALVRNLLQLRADPAQHLVAAQCFRLSPPRTKWTRRVPHPVLIGHAASLTPY